MTTKNLLVTSQNDHAVHEYDVTTGAFVRVAATGLGDPLGIVIGLDGNLLVSDGQANQVKRYDITTGALIDVFASTNLSGPTGMTIHQGVLYVTNSNSPQGVQKFDATTGVNIGSFVPSLANPSPRDVKVNPANNRLYVLYFNAATVETFDLTTMASFGLLMPAGSPAPAACLRHRPWRSVPTVTSTSPAARSVAILASGATTRRRARSSTSSPIPAAIFCPRSESRLVPTTTSTSPRRTAPM
jgi:streptogramin lyase